MSAEISTQRQQVLAKLQDEIHVKYVSDIILPGEPYILVACKRNKEGLIEREVLPVRELPQDNGYFAFAFEGTLKQGTVLFSYEGEVLTNEAKVFIVKPMDIDIFTQGLEYLGTFGEEQVQDQLKQIFNVPRLIFTQPIHTLRKGGQ